MPVERFQRAPQFSALKNYRFQEDNEIPEPGRFRSSRMTSSETFVEDADKLPAGRLSNMQSGRTACVSGAIDVTHGNIVATDSRQRERGAEGERRECTELIGTAITHPRVGPAPEQPRGKPNVQSPGVNSAVVYIAFDPRAFDPYNQKRVSGRSYFDRSAKVFDIRRWSFILAPFPPLKNNMAFDKNEEQDRMRGGEVREW
ncbi:hypothetical protein KM043_006428 [Ampulex compressa]|nr:hypothetical protein KM043_006428 [Ampulex compressa]